VIPAALDFLGGLLPGGWPDVMRHNRELVVAGRRKVLEVIGGKLLAPETMLGSMAAIELPEDLRPAATPPAADADPHATYPPDPLRDALNDEDRIEAPVSTWPHTPADSAPRRPDWGYDQGAVKPKETSKCV
jgi:isopenicillin-N epimerase